LIDSTDSLPPFPTHTLTYIHTHTRLHSNFDSGEAEVRKHLFFRHIDWDKIARLEVQPPFKPRIRDRLDVSNFDKQFTNQKVELSPTDESFMMNVDQSAFDGFSFTCDSFHYPESDDDTLLMLDKRTGNLSLAAQQTFQSGAGHE
jgi:hypothetical protein